MLILLSIPNCAAGRVSVQRIRTAQGVEVLGQALRQVLHPGLDRAEDEDRVTVQHSLQAQPAQVL